MFGLLKGAGCGLKSTERAVWMGHICGVCLALREQGGHTARVATNYDAALISALCEAQTRLPPQRYTSRCPLRSQFKAGVTPPDSIAARYAAAIALTMASTKITDHLADQETVWFYLPGLAKKVARRWENIAGQVAGQLGFDPALITAETARQPTLEAVPNQDFYFYTQPTELAVAAAFQHTAIIARKPHNASLLFEMGRMFGRIMVLLDSYEDYAVDLAAQKFNALAACSDPSDIQPQTKRIFQDSFQALNRHFNQLDLPHPALVRNLLLQQLKRRSYHRLNLGPERVCGCHWPAAELAAPPHSSRWRSVWSYIIAAVGDPSQPQKKQKANHHNTCCLDDCCSSCHCCDCTPCDCDCTLCDCDDGGCQCCRCDNCSCGDGCCCDCNG